MSEEKKSDSSNSKALLYSEILGTSVASHAQELLQKKKKSCTYHVERSSVLERVSKLFHLIDEGGADEKNIEIVEEGKPYIDMSLSLIEREDGSEYDSEVDTEDDFENGIEDKIIISCSDSDSELPKDENEENVFKTVFISSNSENEHSENKDQMNIYRNEQLPLSLDSDHEQSESETNVFKHTKLVMSSDTVNEEAEKGKKFVLEGEGLDTFRKCNDKQSEKESKANADN